LELIYLQEIVIYYFPRDKIIRLLEDIYGICVVQVKILLLCECGSLAISVGLADGGMN
jgi:hypothetical protein